ncbi:hypothetical protein B566_EDAN009382 [Ephemera danica]|nr:hypothetical protein B566_EDAN009382 [Ephemera danica]
MRITFNDSLTQTHEYPSEASLLIPDESSNSSSSNNMDSSPSSPRSPLQPLPSGSGTLASYTPSKILMTQDTFELGVTRAMAATPVLYLDNPSLQDESSSDFLLKPAEDGDTVTWSAETASDLLF